MNWGRWPLLFSSHLYIDEFPICDEFPRICNEREMGSIGDSFLVHCESCAIGMNLLTQ